MKIGIYLQHKYDKSYYKKDCFNVRLFAGVEMIKQVLLSEDYNVDYADMYTMNNYDVILVSITAAGDWWSFISERCRWKKGKYKVIIGGAGFLNVRPFLQYFDIGIFGRAENLIVDVIKNIDCAESVSNAVVESEKFDVNKKYYINQTLELYPHKINIGAGTNNSLLWNETSIGCKRKCFFCAYTYHRKYLSINKKSYSSVGNLKEVTLLDLDLQQPSQQVYMVGIDGVSERLRFMVNKKITDERLIRFIRWLSSHDKPLKTKMFIVVGYPNETVEDYYSFLEVLKKADYGTFNKKIGLLFAPTPFRAMPCTPAAWWPMSTHDFRRNSISKLLKHGQKPMAFNVFYDTNNLWVVEWQATHSQSLHLMDAIILRGTEEDTKRIAMLACNSKFWNASSRIKIATIQKYFNVNKLMGSFDLDTYPVKYLHTYIDQKKMYDMGQKALNNNAGNNYA